MDEEAEEKKIGKSMKSKNTSKGKKKKKENAEDLLNKANLDRKDLEIFCKSHPHNKTHIYCLVCEKFICDKCDVIEHKDHSKESFSIPSKYKNLLDNLSLFASTLNDQKDHNIVNFTERIKELKIKIDMFFHTECERIEKICNELNASVINLKNQNLELIRKYQQKFADNLMEVEKQFFEFNQNLVNLKSHIETALRKNYLHEQSNENRAEGRGMLEGYSEVNLKERFEEFKRLKNEKTNLENEYKKIYSYYSFDLNCLISEFSVREFLQFIEKIKNYLDHRFIDDKNKNFKMVLDDKIKSTIFFDDSKKIFTTKNFLPKNISRVYQPIDNTNTINCYDLSFSTFHKYMMIPDKFPGNFKFKKFSKFLNFSGRLLVCGGYEDDDKLSNKCYIIEDADNFKLEFESAKNNTRSKTNDQIGMSASSLVSRSFYQHINHSYIYDNKMNNNSLRLIEISKMCYGRVGHGLVGFLPNVVLAISGTENLTRCEIFKLDENKWEEIASLNQSRIDCSVLVHNNFVYAFFGISYNRITKKCEFLDTIERISFSSLQTSDWEFITPEMKIEERKFLPRSLCSILPTHSSSTVYIIGGQTERDKFSSEIFQYDLQINYIYKKKETLPKVGGFIESNFVFLYKTAVLFDLHGDIFTYYQNTDTFNYFFREIAEVDEKKKDEVLKSQEKK